MSQIDLLRTTRFWPLFAAQFLGALNDNVYRFALVIFITFRLAESSIVPAGTLVVLSGGIFILPFFLFSALAGQLADRCEKSRLIRLIKFAEIGVMGLGAIGFYLQDAAWLLVVLFLMGTQSAFFGPLKYGILPQHLAEHELTGGNALIQMATYIAILCGAAAGGWLAAWSDTGPLPVVAGVVGVAVAGWLCARRVPEAAPSDPALRLEWNLAGSTWRLLRDALASRETAVLMLTISWFWFLGATFLSLVPSYGKDLLHADERAVTLLNAAFTIGIGIGSLACETLSGRRIELGLMAPAALGISLFALFVGWLGLPQVSRATLTLGHFFHEPAALGMFIALIGIGASGAIYIVPLNTALQARAAPAHRARLIGALNVLNALFMVGSAVFTATIYQAGFDIPTIFSLVAILNVAMIVAALRALPEFRARLRALAIGAR
ncbi:MAG: MFS transporter [Gammaproteobacteria bacterium]